MDEQISRHEIFSSPVPLGASSREIGEYAGEQEARIYTLLSGLKSHFHGYSWRTTQFENVVLQQKANERRLTGRFVRENDVVPMREPSGEKQPPKPDDRTNGEKENRQRSSILVVDDDEAIRDAVVGYLAQDGFSNIDSACDGEEALDFFKRKSHHVVIADIAMPKLHGIDLLRQVKSLSPSSQVIIITGRSGKDSAIAALRLEAFDYFEKPFDFELLSQSVARALRKRESLEGSQ